MRRSRKAQVNISKSPENVHFIGKPGLCSDVVINFEEIMSVNLSLVIITMGENDVSNHPRKNWMIQKAPAYPFNNIMIMRKKLLLRNIPTMVVGVVKGSNKTTNERIEKLNSELRKCLQKKYIRLGAHVCLLIVLTTKLIWKA